MRDVVELKLKSVKDGRKVKIVAYVVDDISNIHSEHVEILKKDYDHLANLWFSDICKFQDTLEVDILVRIDWFWSIQDGNIYADDTNVTIATNDIQNLVTDAQEELLNISDWMRVNKLSPNPLKTEYLFIGHLQKTKVVNMPNGLKLNDSEINKVSKSKSLGVMVD